MSAILQTACIRAILYSKLKDIIMRPDAPPLLLNHARADAKQNKAAGPPKKINANSNVIIPNAPPGVRIDASTYSYKYSCQNQ